MNGRGLPSLRSIVERRSTVLLALVMLAVGVPVVLATMMRERTIAASLARVAASERAILVEHRIDLVAAAVRELADARSAGVDQADSGPENLIRLMRLSQGVIGAAVVDAEGLVIVARRNDRDAVTGRINGERVDVSDREYFQVPRRTRALHVSAPFTGRVLGGDELIAVSAPWYDAGRFGGVIQATIPLGTLMPASGDEVDGICHAVVEEQGAVVTADTCFQLDVLPGLDGRALRDRGVAAYATDAFALHRSEIRNRPGWSVISAVSADRFSLDHGFVVATGALILLASMLVLSISLRLTWRQASASLEYLSRTLRDADMRQPAHTRESIDQLPVDSREVAMIQHAVVELIDRVAFVAALESDNRRQREAHTEQLANALIERDALVAARTEDLRAALEEATAADRAKSRLLANASHELRTPLYGIVGTAELLALRLDADDDRRACRTILSCAESMQHLISDLLTLGRLDQGQAALLAVEFDVGVEVAAALDALRPAASAAGLYLRLDSPRGGDWRRVGDPLRVREIVSNLVGNAIKFTDQGGVTVLIERGADGTLRIDVADTGCGIDPKNHRSIFEPFWQADAADNRHTQGVGLGLAIVRHWAVAMGGDVTVRSVPARGSTFSLHLPLPLPLARPAAAVESTPATPLSPVESSRRVLVVDDIALNRQVLSAQLRVLGFTRIVEAADGFDALSRMRDQDFDLVLLDCQMPGMDGYETATRIRDMFPGSPVRIIAVTAAAGQDESGRCLAAGMDGYVAKPVDLANLQRAVAIDLGEVC